MEKVYEVSYQDNYGFTHSYLVEAPNKRIAKWCGATLHNNRFVTFLSAGDMKAKRYRREGEYRWHDISTHKR